MSAFFLCTHVFSQVFGELLPGSSALIYDENKGVHKLLDGANFIYQGNTMYCDSAYYMERTKTIRAFGNVHIRKSDNINLYCDSLHYYANNGVAMLWGHVRAIDSEYRLLTDSMQYNTRTEQGIYRHGGRIENQMKKEILTSKVGYFYPRAKNFFFRTNVVYESDEIYMTTDSLQYSYAKNRINFWGPTQIFTEDATLCSNQGWYDTKTEAGSLMKSAQIVQESRIIQGDTLLYTPSKKIAEGFGNVFVQDTTEKMAFLGHYAIMNDSLNYSLVTKDAMAIKYQKNDTLYIHADTLYNLNDSSKNRVLTLAYHGVRIFGNSIQGRGDSLSFAKADGFMELYKEPILWAKNGELKGDSMRVYMDDSLVYEARIIGKATAIMEVDSARYYNQVGGTKMVAYFKDNEINIAKVIGNAQTVYFPIDEEKQAVNLDSIYHTRELTKITTDIDTLFNQLFYWEVYNLIDFDSLKKDEVRNCLEEVKTLLKSKFMVLDSINANYLNSTSIDTIQFTIDGSDSTVSNTLPSKKMGEIVTIKRMGMNRFFASEIKVYFDSGEVVGVTYYEQPDGVFYPMAQINKEEQFIQNFKTNFALRPKSVEDLLKD